MAARTGSRSKPRATKRAGGGPDAKGILAAAAATFAGRISTGDVFRLVGEHLHALCGDAIISVASFDAADATFTAMALCGDGGDVAAFEKAFGGGYVGGRFGTVPPEIVQVLATSRFVRIPGGLMEFAFGLLDQPTARRLERKCRLGDLFGIGLCRDGEVFGNAVIMTRRGAPPPPAEFIETYATLVSITLLRLKAQAALRESEERYRSLIEHSPLGILSSDASGNILLANPALLAILGSPDEEATKKVNLLTFPPLVESGAADAFRRCMQTGATVTAEIPYTSKWGREIVARIVATPVREAGGAVGGFQAFIEDVSDRRRADGALRASQERYRQLVDTAPDVIYSVAADSGIVTSLNPAFEKITGWSRDEVLGRPFSLLVHPDDLPIAAENFRKILRHETPPLHELRVRAKNGEYLVGEFTSAPLVENGRVVEDFGIVRDVTGVRRASDALKESEEKFRSLVERSLAGIYIIQDLLIVYANPMMATTFGYSTDEITGLPILDLVDTPDRPLVADYIRRREQGEIESVHYRYRGLTKDRRRIEIEVHGTRTEFRGRPAIIGTLLDVTERVRAEEALRDSERRLADLIAFLPDPMFAIDTAGRVIAWNRACEDLTGVGAADMIGRGEFEVGRPFYGTRRPVLGHLALNPRDETIERHYPFVISDGDTLTTEVYVPVPGYKAEGVWLWGKAAPLYDAHGRITGAVEVVRDVTERKKAEQALVDSEQRYRALAESSPDFIFTIGGGGVITYVNSYGAAQLGFKPEDLVGRRVAEFFPGDTARRMGARVREVFETGETLHTENFTEFPAGPLWLDTWLVPLKDDGGAVTGVIGLSRDRTRRKKVEDDLVKTTAELTAIFDAIPDLYFRMATDGTILDYKAGRTGDLYVPPEKFLGKRMPDVLPPDVGALLTAVLRGLAEKGGNQSVEYSLPMRGGEEHFEARLAHLREGEVIAFVRNITDRRRAEEALIGKERYQALFERSLDCVFIHDFDGRFLDANNAMLATLGYAEKELMQTDFLSILDPAHHSLAREAFAEVRQTGSQRAFNEYRLRRKDGSYVYLETKGSTVYREGQAWAIQGIARNVTKRKRAEHALTESERLYRELYEKYRNILESSPDAITVVDLQGTIVECNQPAVAMHAPSATREDLIGKNAFDLIAPADRDRAAAGMQRTLAEGAVKNLEYTLIRGTGEAFPGEMSVSLVRDAAGRPVSFVGIIKDITDRKRAEGALRESEEKFRGLFESSRDAIMTLAPPSWRFTSGNMATVAMFRARDADEFISYEPWRLSPERQPDGRPSADKAIEMIETAMKKGSHFFEWAHRRIDGEEFPASVLLTRVEQAGKRFLQATVRDLTEHKRLEQQAIQSEKMAAVGTLVAGLSHELNNPIGVILGYAQSMLKRTAPDSPLHPALLSMEREAQRCANLVKVLLDFSRTSPSSRQRVPAEGVIRRIADIVAEQAVQRSLNLAFLGATGTCPDIYVNTTEIESAVFNLVTNAMDATPPGGTVALGLAPAAREGTQGVEIRVEDTGSGMPPEVAAKIFEPFFTTKPVGKGTGLGLSIARQVVESHGGRIDVETAVGRGTTMRIWLPGAGASGAGNGIS